jgi:hypothetical protein
VESTIKTLATKDDIADIRDDIAKSFAYVKADLASLKYDLTKQIRNSIKWMFIFWLGQMSATLAIVLWLR